MTRPCSVCADPVGPGWALGYCDRHRLELLEMALRATRYPETWPVVGKSLTLLGARTVERNDDV